ncbi:MAG: hypothetical protein P8182_19640 [Deltaproteobacteria bacterium]
MSVWNTIRAWFFENVWPLIQKFLALVIEKTLEWLSEQVNGFLDDSAERLSQRARSRAEDELAKAQDTKDPAEAEKHRAVAAVWQRVAGDIKDENIRIKGRLAEVFTKEKAEFATRIGALKPEDVFEVLSGEEVKLRIDGTDLVVPATIIGVSHREESRKPE